MHQNAEEAFRNAASQAVSKRDYKGNIPGQASILLTFQALNDHEKLRARTWIVTQRQSAKLRCDPLRAEAWQQVLDRVNRVHYS